MPEPQATESTYIDSHCHYQPSWSFPDYFAAIANNMSAYRQGTAGHCAICLVEMPGTDWFSALANYSPSASFSVVQQDPQTLLVRSGEQAVTVFRAHQVNSSEKIEVIVVGHGSSIAEGLPLAEYLDKYAGDYLVILPWGVGKWLGRRGQLVSASIQRECRFVLGDNGGRPYWWYSIPQFTRARALNIPVLAGSDPLPLKSLLKRVATYGQVFDGVFSNCDAWITEVKNLTHTPPVYGRASGTLGFIVDQLGLRLNKIFNTN